MQILFECDKFILKHDPHPGRVGYVTFTSWEHSKNVPGFAEAFLSPRQIPAFYFISRSNHWWQSGDMQAAAQIVRTVREKTGLERLVAYGSSMGGYGAARWGADCGADAHLLIAPQFTVDPSKPPHEMRWQSDARKIRFDFDDMGAVFPQARNVLMIHDPLSEDAKHADLYRMSAPFSELTLPHCGHVPGIIMNETKGLSQLVLSYMDGIPDTALVQGIRARFRTNRSLSPRYLHGLAGNLQKRHPHWAHKLQTRAIQRDPKSLPLLLRGIELAFSCRDTDPLMPLVVRAIGIAPDHAAPWRAMYRLLQLRKDTAGALEAARQSLARRPESGDLTRVVALAMLEDGQAEKAVAVIERATSLEAAYPGGWQLRGQILERLGRKTEALASYREAHRLGMRNAALDSKIAQLEAIL